jgi:hypothetical protein
MPVAASRVDVGDADIEARCLEGMAWNDGWCSPRLALALRTAKPLHHVDVSLWNPDVNPIFSGNKVSVRLDRQTQVRESVPAGEQLEMSFNVVVNAGAELRLEIESAVDHRAPDDVRPLGLVILGLAFA